MLNNIIKKINVNKIFFISVIIMFILAGIARSLELLTKNYVFLFDHGLYYLDVKKIVIDHNLTLIGTYSPIEGLFQSPIFYYLLSIFFILFKGDPYGGIVLTYIASLGAVLISYVLLKNLFGKRIAFFTSLALAASPAAINASSHLWPPHFIFFIMPFYIFFLTKSFEKSKYLYLTVLTAGLVSSFELAAGCVLFLPIIIIFILQRNKYLRIKTIILFLSSSLIPFLPQIIFDFRHNHIMLNGLFRLFSGELGRNTSSFKFILIDHFKSYLGSFKASIPLVADYWYLVIIFLFITILIFLKKNLLSQKEKKYLLVLIFLPLLSFVQYLLLQNTIWQWYLIPSSVCFSFLLGFVLSKTWNLKIIKFITPVIVLLLFYFLINQIHYRFTSLNNYGGTAKVKGKLEAIDYIYKDAKGKPFSLFVFTPPVYDYPYQYLLWWYAKPQYGYLPNQTKNGNFYLLIEKDINKPWSYNGWLETVIRDGKIIFTKELPQSHFIIQKRQSL